MEPDPSSDHSRSAHRAAPPKSATHRAVLTRARAHHLGPTPRRDDNSGAAAAPRSASSAAEQLCDAGARGDVRALQRLLHGRHVDPDQVRPPRTAPPHTAPHLLPEPHRPTPAPGASTASLWALITPLYLFPFACDPDQGDYDKRTATHLAASEGRWAAVRFLLEEGGADANPLDRWGRHGPTSGRLGGAMSGHHQLLRQTGSEGLGLPSARVRGGRAPQIPQRGHVPGTSPPSTIPIHTASGHPRWGGTPLDDAMRSKHALVANYLRTKGGLSGQEIRSRAEAETRGSGWFR